MTFFYHELHSGASGYAVIETMLYHHNKYQLGDPVRIKVAAANLEKKQLDFVIAGEEKQNGEKPRKNRG